MTKRFNSKQYAGKSRVYPPIPGTAGIRRVWIWNEKQSEYAAGSYEARRYDHDSTGKKVRVKRSFDSLQEARAWQNHVEAKTEVEAPAKAETGPTGPLFRQIVGEWQTRRYPALSEGTRLQYERMLEKHFRALLDLPIQRITPKQIDLWIDELKSPKDQPPRRRAFDHELTLLGVILRYYSEYHDDATFIVPIKKRHRKAVATGAADLPKKKDLTEDEFFKFREILKAGVYGELMAALATVQYYQALRISEATALHWEDIQLDEKTPSNSRMSVVRSVFWPRRKGLASYVKAGFKNAKANDGIKEQPVMPDVYRVLRSLYQPGVTGLIFRVEGTHLEYRSIQHAYDTAFKLAGLSYSGTHIMRHGGCRRLFNKNGDLAVAQQLLGNSDMKSALVYAKRHKNALTSVVLQEWEESEGQEAGRKRSQDPAA